MASMWNRLLAAMLTVGRKARLLTVGSSSCSMSVPMGWGRREPGVPAAGVPRAGRREETDCSFQWGPVAAAA